MSPKQPFRLAGMVAGPTYAVLVVVALALAPSISLANHPTVVQFYSQYGQAVLWQVALIGVALVCFVWFAGTFARQMSAGPAVAISAAAMTALYLVAFGCWESLAKTYTGVDVTGVPAEAYRDAHVLYNAGIGVTLAANFMGAAFVGATAGALLTAAPAWRRTGWIGLGLATLHLVNAVTQIVAKSDFTDAMGAIILLTMLVWVSALSAVLIITMRSENPVRTDTPVADTK